MAGKSLNYRRGRSGRPLARRKAEVYATETHCCFCGLEVDKTLPYLNPYTGKPDPWSKSIEHPDINRDPYDVHLAHLGCNIRDGASKGGRIIAARKHGTTSTEITSSPGWEQTAADYGGKAMALANVEPLSKRAQGIGLKLNRTQVDQIIELRRQRVRIVDVAERFGISIGMVSHITSGRYWKTDSVFSTG